MKNVILAFSLVATLVAGTQSSAQIIMPGPINTAPNPNTQAAQQAQQALSQGAMMNMMMGGMLLASCMMESKPNMLICMMGGLMLAQGMSQKQAADNAQNSLNQSSTQQQSVVYVGSPTYPATAQVAQPYGYNYGTPAGVPVQLNSSILPSTAPPAAARGLAALSSAGYQVTSAGVTMPNGRYLEASSLNTSEGMASAGFDSRSVQSAQSASVKVRQQAAKQFSASNN